MTTTVTPTITEASIIAKTLALFIAERDDLHPAHALNRVRAACRLVDTAERHWSTFHRTAADQNPQFRASIARLAGVQASDATWEIAEMIVCTECEDMF